VIGLLRRPPPDNTQHSQETDIYTPAGFNPTFPASKQPQAYALDLAAPGIDILSATLAQTYFESFSVTM